MECRIIDREHAGDIRLKNDPFALWGRMIPACRDGIWDYTVETFREPGQMCFPEENYVFEDMTEDHIFVGAYEGDTCVGLAVLAEDMFRYLYLDDLKVSRDYRGRGIGKALIRSALAAALERGYAGLHTVGQDNNLSACLFYLNNGFEIGGFDNRSYRFTSQEGKGDIHFYLDGRAWEKG